MEKTEHTVSSSSSSSFVYLLNKEELNVHIEQYKWAGRQGSWTLTTARRIRKNTKTQNKAGETGNYTKNTKIEVIIKLDTKCN